MAKQTINLGNAANNGNDGDDARTAFSKVNDNFTEVYALAGGAQPANAKLTALAGAVWAANQLQYQAGAGTVANTPFTVAARALLDDADFPAMRVTLGLGGQILQALQALTMTSNGVPYMASASTMAVQPSSAFGRGLLNLAGEAAGRAAFGALGVGSYGLGTSNGPTTTIAALDTLVENMFVSTSEGGAWGAGAAGSYPMGFNITRSPSVKAQFAISYGTKAAGGGAYYRNTTGSGVWAPWAKLLEAGDYGIGAASVLETAATAWQGNKFTGWAAAAPDTPNGQVNVGLDMGYNVERRFQIGISTSNHMHFRYTTDASGNANWKKVVVEGDAGIGLNSQASMPGNSLLLPQGSGFWGGTSQGTAGMPADTVNNGMGIWTAGYTGSGFHFAIATVNRKFHFGYSSGNGSAPGMSEVFHQNNSAALPLTTHLAPSTDNNRQLGTSGTRWSVVYSATGAINTSDAREKTSVSSLTASETEAAKQLSREIGTYKWLKMVEEKGDGARKHIGLTVQRAIQIMESCGLDPFSYGFICYDEWEDEFEHSEAVTEPVMTEEVWGNDPEGLAYLVSPSVQALDEHGEPVYRVITEATDVQVKWGGNRYSFRYDELNLFIAAGIEARLSELEKRM